MKGRSASDESHLDDLLLKYEELQEAGTSVPAEALCRDCPHLLPESRRRIAALESVNDVLNERAGVPSPNSAPPAAAIRLNCPHCRNPIELLVQPPEDEIVCPSCGSSFRLNVGSTLTWDPDRLPKLGKFELLRRLGVGAFGAVYAARDSELKRTIAVKIPRSGTLTGPEDEDRFLREARNAAQLPHPGTVPVFEVGRSGQFPYIVSELVDGLTLSDVLTDRRFSFREVAKLVRQLGGVALAMSSTSVEQSG